ncbi:MAG TPA: hypothetical protein VFG15_30360 [Amycolatopsis sp.]|nr:hypothetical protein [Amycolatopsis sp.]
MPNQPAPGQVSPKVRMPRELWEAAGRVAAAQGTDRGAVVRDFLRWYTGESGVMLPVRAERRPAP